METKSRYEVISDLEKQKQALIKERDGLNDQLVLKENHLEKVRISKEENLKKFKRNLEDLEKDKKDNEQVFKRKTENLAREKEDQNIIFEKKNNELLRNMEDGEKNHVVVLSEVEKDIKYFKETLDVKKESINNLIKSVEESINRFKNISYSENKKLNLTPPWEWLSPIKRLQKSRFDSVDAMDCNKFKGGDYIHKCK